MAAIDFATTTFFYIWILHQDEMTRTWSQSRDVEYWVKASFYGEGWIWEHLRVMISEVTASVSFPVGTICSLSGFPSLRCFTALNSHSLNPLNNNMGTLEIKYFPCETATLNELNADTLLNFRHWMTLCQVLDIESHLLNHPLESESRRQAMWVKKNRLDTLTHQRKTDESEFT